jgi:4-amino-4-deoxy-L-arabinose transferase-like glycosyltransferase
MAEAETQTLTPFIPKTNMPASVPSLLPVLLIAAVMLFYAVLRLAAWYNTSLLDDTDSIFYIGSITAYHSMDLNAIDDLNSDSTPFYPTLGALATSLTGNPEVAGRLVSFVFSLVLVATIGLIAHELDGNTTALLAMLILAWNGPMISLSVAVLTETSYIGTIYLGFYLLWKQLEAPTLSLRVAAGLGLLFGLAFLNRTEGILYILAVPVAVLLIGWLMRDHQTRHPFGRVTGWCTIYVVVFVALAIPQILYVSTKMGVPAINGRNAWQTLVSAMPNRSINATVFGLDLAEDQLNINYIRSNYADAVKQLDTASNSDVRLAARIKQSLRNLNKIYTNLLADQITPIGFTLALVGLVALYLRGRFRVLVYNLAILAVLLAGPVAHTSVLPRHIAAVIPLFCIFQGIGLRQTADLLRHPADKFSPQHNTIWLILIAVVLGASLSPLMHALKPPRRNAEYDPSFLSEPVRLIRNMEHVSSISAQRAYIGYFSGIAFHYAPYTQYDKLVRYLKANGVDLFYVDFHRMADYPYINEFLTDGYRQNFKQIWVGEQDGRMRASLFKLEGARSAKTP